jgi:hypothetical protein
MESTKTRPGDSGTDLDHPMIHWYDTGGRDPRQGDVAICGWVKRTPHNPSADDAQVECVVCVGMVGAS